MEREIITTITACTGDQVIVTQDRIEHILENEYFSRQTVLGYLQIILKDPSDIFLEESSDFVQHLMFYRREVGRYFVAVVKKTLEKAFLSTMHPTGKKIRNKHIILERIK